MSNSILIDKSKCLITAITSEKENNTRKYQRHNGINSIIRLYVVHKVAYPNVAMGLRSNSVFSCHFLCVILESLQSLQVAKARKSYFVWVIHNVGKLMNFRWGAILCECDMVSFFRARCKKWHDSWLCAAIYWQSHENCSFHIHGVIYRNNRFASTQNYHLVNSQSQWQSISDERSPMHSMRSVRTLQHRLTQIDSHFNLT